MDRLNRLYESHGFFVERVQSVSFPGSDGMAEMKTLMQRLFENPLQAFGEDVVLQWHDFSQGVQTNGNERLPIDLPKSEMVMARLQSGSTVIIRPSGTEPKLKIYLMCRAQTAQLAETSFKTLSQAVNAAL